MPKLVTLLDDVTPGIEQRIPTPEERGQLVGLLPDLQAAMRGAGRHETRRMVAKLALGFPNAQRLSDEDAEARLELYATALADVPADTLDHACKEALRKFKFFPAAAELRALCRDPHRRAFRLARAKFLIAKHDREWKPPVAGDDEPMTDEQRAWLAAYYERNGLKQDAA